jgi:ribosomal protein S18 acetylase RimI-like enzyme
MIEFELAFARRQATHVHPVPGGFAVRHADFPASQNNNRLLIRQAADPGDILDAADRVLADLDHHLITVYDDPFGSYFAAAAVAAGYQHVPLLTMTHDGDHALSVPAVAVSAVEPAALIASLRHEWRLLLPDSGQDRIDQLARRVTARLRGVRRVDFLAVVDGDRMAARVDLYIQDGVAQLEYVATSPEYRGRGYARAVVLEALHRSRAAGCELIFLFAEEQDWPCRWYQRLGFGVAGRIHEFIREPPP